MIEVNKNTLASALPALGKLICRTSPMTLFKSIKIESADGKLRLSTTPDNQIDSLLPPFWKPESK